MGGGPPEFPQGFSCLVVLWILLAVYCFRVRGFHPLWPDFPDRSTNKSTHLLQSVTPERTRSGLGSFHFARRYFGNRVFFLFLALLRCFSSGGSPHIPMYSVYDDKTFLLPDCSIRKSADQSLLTAPRSLSQLVTSFFGSRCQGIPLVLFVA